MEQDDQSVGPTGYVFAVAETPYCCWDFDHEARTLEFLGGLDSAYFALVASLSASQLTESDAIAASVLLRVTYHQGLETLMTLLGAAIQAPLAVPAWIAKCSTGDLKELVAAVRGTHPVLTRSGRRRVSFAELSEHIHKFAWVDESGDQSTAALFGRFWQRLSGELLDDTARAEYNALKHGNRVRGGGFTLAIGLETTVGEPAPPEEMHSLGGSDYGSTFFVSERVGESSHHMRTRRTSLNWSPDALAERLYMISMSIGNVVGAMRCMLGVDPESVEFSRPSPLSAFDDVWSREPSMRASGFDTIITIDPGSEVSRAELRKMLERLDDPAS